ncbi:MAG: efflux RND transporter permease subunit, partial [Candidatus Muiribacteriota bacterium]
YFRKITINVMSMSGFLFAFGMLYDNSVIVMEHLLRMKERKPDSGIYQIYKSVMKISSPILISTVTTFSVFIPVIFMRKDLYIMYKDFTEVLSFSLFLSFFSSIIIIPYFIYHFDFLKGKKTKKYKNYEYFNTYFIAKTLIYRKYIAVIFCLIIISGLISYIFTGNSSIGQTPDNTFILHCQPGLSTSAEKFTADMIKIEEYLVTHDEVEKIFSTKNDENYRVVIRVKKGKVRQFIKKYEEITDSLTLYPDVHVFLINAPGETFKNIDLLIYDKSYTERFRKAHIVYSTLSENLKNSQIVIKEKPPVDEMDIILSREKLISAGFSLKETAYILRAYLEGPKFDLGFDNKITETRMKLENITDVEEIKSLILRKLNFLTLKDISDIKLSRNPSVINTENGQPVTKIGIMWTGESESAVMKKITEILNELNSKRNQKIIWEFDESSRRIYEDRNEMTKTVLYTLILLTIILYMYYGSFKDVILVFSVIPFTYSVIIILMAVFKIPWSLPVYIAFLLLSGIIINNSILIIDLIEKDKSFSILFKIAHSINDKFRAIVITTATTALGIFPLVFAEGFWQIMGIISIAGLITGMLASLYLIPVLYYLTGEYFGKSNSA